MNILDQLFCTNCGGILEKHEGYYLCKNCGSKFYEKQMNSKLFVDIHQAENERQSANFDNAKNILLKLTKEFFDEDLSDVYWNLLLCEQGVIFETDGKGEQFPSFYNINTKDCKQSFEFNKVIEYCTKFNNAEKIGIYSMLVDKIDKAKTMYQDIRSKVNPYDIFICFKNSDENGNQTKDRTLASDIYNELSSKYNVFFSEKTLKNIKSDYRNYEPNIYYGLYSAKVMLLICSKKEYLESTWLKNEWSRFDKINSASNGKKVIIPIFTDDFNPSDLPESLWHYQGINNDVSLMSNLKENLSNIINKDDKKNKKLPIILSSVFACLALFGVGIFMILSQTNYIFKLVNDSYSFVGLKKNTESELVIESTYKNHNITEIGKQAFFENDKLVSITLPDTIQKIDESAFEKCSNLKNVYYLGDIEKWGMIQFENSSSNPMSQAENFFVKQNNEWTKITSLDISSITSISNFAFYNFEQITSVSITSNLGYVGESAFYNNNFSAIVLPETVTKIGFSAFESCDKLASITLPFACNKKLNASYTYFGYIFGASKHSLNKDFVPSSLVDVTINGGEIGSYCFDNCSKISNLKLNNITSIQDYAFYKCSSLFDLTLGKTLLSVGENCFNSCSNLTNIYYLGNIEDWCKIDFLSNSPKEYCTNLFINNQNTKEIKNLSLNTIDKLKPYVFSNFEKLESVEIGSMLTIIPKNAFKDCINLQSVQLPLSLLTIDENAFSGCDLFSINLPNFLVEIKDSAFKDNANLSVLNVPNSVTKIGDYAFYNCCSLSNISLSSNIEYIGNSAFDLIGDIIYYTNNNGKYLGNERNNYLVFVGMINTELLSIEINTNTKIIYSNAFKNSKITGITLPENIKCIGSSAFKNTSNLNLINLGSNIEYIEESAFYGKTLSTLTLPNTIKSIGPDAFTLSQIENLYYQGSIEEWTQIDFEFLGANPATISNHFYINSIDYKNQSIVIISNIEEIKQYAFAGFEKITKIILPNTLTKLGSYAFAQCSLLNEIVLTENITEIGEGCFYQCSSLNSITIPNKVNYIGCFAFKECSSLTSANFVNKDNWYQSTNPSFVSKNLLNLSQTDSIIASYLKNTYTNSYWKIIK